MPQARSACRNQRIETHNRLGGGTSVTKGELCHPDFDGLSSGGGGGESPPSTWASGLGARAQAAVRLCAASQSPMAPPATNWLRTHSMFHRKEAGALHTGANAPLQVATLCQ